ncbi:MAG: hypothetical protein BWX73_02644 [Lentisphaerae bacterium ADurb.Bin082]|nr:MAG: hypothetical protein BWX73_02644 [Lentisphaerae bacterium ADurb.Bin082]
MKLNSLIAAGLLAATVFTVTSCRTCRQTECVQTEAPRCIHVKDKKLIHFGWVAPSTIEHFNDSTIEQLNEGPFDGLGIIPSLKLNRNGEVISYYLPRAVGAPQILTEEDLKDWVPAIKRLQQTRLKHNFIRSNSSLFTGNWFDDEGWKRTLNNYGMLAWLAKQSDCEGLCIDIEAYEYTGRPFQFKPELGYTYEETAAKVRQRGKEWIEELNRQFPGLTLFTFFWTSQCDDEQKIFARDAKDFGTTGLQIPFFNGVYDGAPDNMKIVDGNEHNGYHAAGINDYNRITANFYRFGKGWIDPIHHEKFNRITSMGVALYLDSYVPREKPGAYNLFARTDNPTQFLYENLSHALSFSDEYVWMWCEKGVFWPSINGTKTFKAWDDLLPSTNLVIEAAKNPFATTLKYADKTNVLRNGELNAGESGAAWGPNQEKCGITSWSSWQSSHSPTGIIKPADGAVRMIGVTDGCIAQSILNIKEGEQFVVTAKAKSESSISQPNLTYFFRDSKGTGLWALQRSHPFTEEIKDGWKRSTVIVTVPSGLDVKSLCISVGCKGAPLPEGKEDKGVLFDDVGAYRVAYPWIKK